MEKDLRMEVFSSKDIVRATCLHVYQLHTQKIDNAFSIIRGAAWKLRNYFHVGVFEDGKRIYTTEKIEGTEMREAPPTAPSGLRDFIP